MRQPDRFIALKDGRRIACAEYGDARGLPFIALHGTPGSRLMFSIADAAARDRGLRLIAPERPGCGQSDFVRFSDLRQAAEDIRHVADAYGLDRFGILGVSGGAPFAIAAASQDRSRTALLALISPVGPIADLGNAIPISMFHSALFTGLGRSGLAMGGFFSLLRSLLQHAPGVAYKLLLKRVPPSDRDLLQRDEVRASLQDAIREGLLRGVAGAVQDLRLYCAPWHLDLHDVEVPAMVFQGNRDRVVPPSAAYALADRLPNCKLEVVEGAGHYWIFGQFACVLDAIGGSLRSEIG